ncbi:hypothetical protein QQF64_004057 [Cirrhinus molitorella]|uniref:Uncharacterized protein n=1 Tax=Cirrhinus molitorella TaxID=172907 RepID=A0ABR3MN24_9TELE
MLRSSEPLSECERSHSRRPALSPALCRAGMKRCGDGERVRPSVLLEEREGKGGTRTCSARQLMKKRAKREREENKQTKAVLFINFSPLRVFFGFVESRSSRRESGPRLRDFSLCELSRDVREELRSKPGTGFSDRADTESARKWSPKHIIASTT